MSREKEKAASTGATEKQQAHENSIKSIIPQGGQPAKDFLQAYFGDNAPGWLTLTTFKGDISSTSWYSNGIAVMARDAMKLAQSQNVYFGLGLRKEKLAKGRGKAEDVAAIPGFWLEIDLKDGVHAAKNLPTMEEAKELLKVFSLKPSIAVHSGGGVHLYWLLDSLLVFQSENERQQVADWMERFQGAFIRLAREKRWKIDNTSDLARILRIPGTLNHKGQEPKPVTIIKLDQEARYSYQDMQAAIEEIEAKLPARTAKPTKREPGAGADIPPADARKIVEKCNFIRHCRDDAQRLPEPEWKKMVHVLAFAENGAEVIHELSSPHRGYDPRGTDQKIQQSLESGAAPYTCGTIEADHGEYCQGCPYFDPEKSPIRLGMETTEEKVAAALEVVQGALEKAAAGEKKAINTPQVIGALALIEDKDPIEFSNIEIDLKELKLYRTVKTAIKKHRANLRLVQPGETADQNQLKDWKIDEGRLYRYKFTEQGYQRILVTVTAPRITKVMVSEESNHEYWEIQFRSVRGRQVTVQAARENLATKRGAISELSPFGFDIGEDNARDVSKYLRDYAAAYAEQTEEQRFIEHFGWSEDYRSFVIGNDVIGGQEVIFKAPGAGEQQLANGFTVRGTLKDWKKIIPLIKEKPWAMFKLYQAFLPPLLPILRVNGHTLANWGESSEGKTLTDQVAASVWGQPDYKSEEASIVIQGKGMTNDRLEKGLSVSKHLPYFLQDAHEARADIAAALHNVEMGQTSPKGDISNGSRKIKPIKTVWFITSETSITGLKPQGGIAARVIEKNGSPLEEKNPLLAYQIERTIFEQYGHAGRQFIQFLIDNQDDWEEWRTAFQDMQEQAIQQTADLDNKVSRTNKYYIAVMMAGKLADEALGLGLGEEKVENDIALCLAEARETMDTRPYYEKALDVLRDWIPANRHDFYIVGSEDSQGYGRDIPGVWNEKEEFVAMFPDRIAEVLKKREFDLNRCVTEWRNKGYLNLDSKGKPQKGTWFPPAGVSRRMYQLTYAALGFEAKEV